MVHRVKSVMVLKQIENRADFCQIIIHVGAVTEIQISQI